MDAQATSAVTLPDSVPAEPAGLSCESSPARRKLKPEGLPSIATMIVTVLQEAGKAKRPVEIADYVRKRWWPTVSTTTVNALVWRMAKEGRLTWQDGRYGLNGVGH